MVRRAHKFDTVRLTRVVDGWPAGTVGAVVSEHPETALVEVVSDGVVDGGGLPTGDLLDDLISVPYAALEIVRPARAISR